MAKLNVNQNLITIFSNNINCVYDIDTNNIIHLKSTVVPQTNLKCSGDPYLGLIRYCSTISNDGRWYAVADERYLIIWSTSNWIQKSIKLLERSASKIIFTPTDRTILVADKTGDVYSFSVTDDSCSKGVLLMGHLSILLDITMTSNEKFIISCDRDEKIRISHYPNTYNIKRFCLDHSAFVTKIRLLNDDILLSCSGDGFLKFWNFLDGKCVSSYYVVQDIKDDLADVEVDQYIITNVETFNLNSTEIIICLSVHEYNGILIYSCNSNLNFSMKIIQKINCNVPLDFVIQTPLIWIFNFSNSCCLNAFKWNDCTNNFENLLPCNINNALRAINEELMYSDDCSQIDLTVLHKKYNLKEKVSKKVRLS